MPKQLEYEPILTDLLPKSLRQFPTLSVMEMYAYQAVGRGPARLFYKTI
jgi:hypothetical protein